MIIQRSQNNTVLLSFFPPSFTFLSSTFLFNWFVFFQFISNCFFNLLDTKVNPNCLLFSESRCEWSLFGHFYSRISFLFFFSVLWETGRYRLKYCQKGPLNPKQPINQIQSSPVYSCYHVYPKVSDKNPCRSRDSDLTTHSAIPDSIARRFVVV